MYTPKPDKERTEQPFGCFVFLCLKWPKILDGRLRMSILQYIRYFVIGVIPLTAIVIIMNAIAYGCTIAPDYISIILGIIVLAYLVAFIIIIGTIIDEAYLRK
jgi:hypothetical protein